MAIVKSINEWEFIEEFKNANRENNFSREGLFALYEWYEELSECYEDNNYELDVIAICCEWSELTNDDLISDYDYIIDSFEVEEEFREDNGISAEYDTDDDTFEKRFTTPLNEEEKEELKIILVEKIKEELENNTTIIELDNNSTLVMIY